MLNNSFALTSARLLSILLLALVIPAHAAIISLHIADVSASVFEAHGIQVVVQEDSSAELTVSKLIVGKKTWRKIRLRCADFKLTAETVECRQGKLSVLPELRLNFVFEYESKQLALNFFHANESWKIAANFSEPTWHMLVQLRDAQPKRLAPLLSSTWPQLGQGRLNGTLRARGDGTGLSKVDVDLKIANLAFADVSGLHAAEKLAGKLRFEALRARQGWNWNAAINWQGGELFWQPLYLRGGHSLQASGQLRGNWLQVTQAQVELADIGKVDLALQWDREKGELVEAEMAATGLKLKPLFANFARPFLDETLLAASELSGRADVALQYRQGAMKALWVRLHNAALQDEQKRIVLQGLEANIPWLADTASQADVSFNEGVLWGVPITATQLQIDMRGLAFAIHKATLPIWGGKLELQDFELHKEAERWRWDFSSMLSPISMKELSAALGWPEMHGELSGKIPKVSYRNKILKVDGKLSFSVFNGKVEANDIVLFDPFGQMPRFSGNLEMRNLDLDLLTHTFSFGNMQGRIDVSVNQLDLINWQAVSFAARVTSSPGYYSKKISQRAVQNISALGGAGGAAALQRSFMRLFENFGYSQIGLSCVLKNSVCEMGGIAQGGEGYVIVSGGGIPAINVIGYNRRVDWNELLTRLKRVTQGNMNAVVK